VYRSTDEGASWARESAKMKGSLNILASGEAKNGVAAVIPSPADPETAFLVGLGSTHWVTEDNGETYKDVVSDYTIDVRLLPHPTDSTIALSYKHNKECIREGKHHCFGELLLTTDSGESWRSVAERVKYPSYAWTQTGTGLLMVQHSTADRKSEATRWDPELDLIYSSDLCENTQVMVEGGNNFAVVGPYVFVAKAESLTDVSLYVSKDDSKTYAKAKFPAQLSQRSYGIMDTSEDGSIFASVRDGDPNVRFSSLYLSDAAGEHWTLSMKHTHHERGYGVDLAKFHGLRGIYLANQVVNAAATRQQGVSPEMQTVVTFDSGGEWFPITGPEKDSDGEKYLCLAVSRSCRLHLFFRQNRQGVYGIYAPENAAGLALATGYMGPAGSLDDVTTNEMGLYLSRDAGRSWVEIRKGAYTYEMGDHGALLLIAKHRTATEVVHYSWDEGETWEDIAIPRMEVTNIVTEPASTSQKFIVMGRNRETDSEDEGGGSSLNKATLVYLDLTGLHERECKGADSPGKEDSDYEVWNPSAVVSGENAGCSLGVKTAYVRRKRGKKCFNGLTHESHTQEQVCECTHEDYVCAYGYERKGKECVRQKAFYSDPKEESLHDDLAELYKNRGLLQATCAKHADQTELYLTSGYKLAPGDQCKGGLVFDEPKLYCEQNMSVAEEVEHHWGYALTGLGIAGAALAVIVLYVLYKRATSPSVRYEALSTDGNDGVQVFGQMDPDLDDDFGDDELAAEGIHSRPLRY